jgi:hypothetical protein
MTQLGAGGDGLGRQLSQAGCVSCRFRSWGGGGPGEVGGQDGRIEWVGGEACVLWELPGSYLRTGALSAFPGCF